MKKPLILVYFILTSPKRGYLVLVICFQTGYVLHMVVHAYHSNIIQDFVCVYLRSMTQYVRLWHGRWKRRTNYHVRGRSIFCPRSSSPTDCRKLERSKGPSVMSKSGGVMCVVLFFLHHGFVPIGFSW